MKKLNFVLILVVAFMVLVVVGCKPATIVVPPPVIDDNNPPIPPSGNDELNASQQTVVKSAVSAVMKEIDTVKGAAEGTWSNDTYKGEYSLTMENDWTIYAWGDKTDGASLLSMSTKTGTHAIEFTITKAAAEGTGTIEVILDGKTYTSNANEIVVADDVPEKAPAMTDEEKSVLQSYIFGFGHDKTIQDLNSILYDAEIAGIKKPFNIVSDADKIQLTLELDGYDYDGSHGDKTLTGTVNYEFIGSIDVNGLFQASEYAYWTDEDGVTFKGDDSGDITAVIAENAPVTGKFSSKSVGGIELELSFIMSGDKPAGIVAEDLQVVKLQAPTDGSISTPTSVFVAITDILGDVSGYGDAVAGADEGDLTGIKDYASIAQMRNREKLWWAGTGQVLDGWTSEDAVYNAENGTLTFDITLTDYNYSTNEKTVSGNVKLIFHGVAGTVEGKPVLNATLWQIVSDGELVFKGGTDNLTVSDVDFTGPIVKGKTIGGAPAVITFPLNGTMWDRSFEFPGDFTSYINKYLSDQYIGLSNLTGQCEFGGNIISGEMVNILIDKYGSLLG